ncbi:hypothetical protein LMG28727_01655 [Paraburkholderia kirstenboschensis]|jgi:hypothetical protein|nr:hypothetical protein [Paraburkholderia kirstenboschensis]CAD6521583.1 hypothetical protein LMG28727_01655 [Paraburkholderia kirstenboschensis]
MKAALSIVVMLFTLAVASLGTSACTSTADNSASGTNGGNSSGGGY